MASAAVDDVWRILPAAFFREREVFCAEKRKSPLNFARLNLVLPARFPGVDKVFRDYILFRSHFAFEWVSH